MAEVGAQVPQAFDVKLGEIRMSMHTCEKSWTERATGRKSGRNPARVLQDSGRQQVVGNTGH